MTEQIPIRQVPPSPEVLLHLPDGSVLSGPRGASVEKFLQILPAFNYPLMVGAIVNSELRELTYPIDIESNVTPVTMADADGARIYRRSLTFLVEAAFHEIYPDDLLTIDHSIASGGFFCKVLGKPKLEHDALDQLQAHMQMLVQQDLPFEREKVPLAEAVEYFQQIKDYEKIRLLKYRNKDHLILYRLGDYRDYHHGYMVPSTGYLKWFALMPFGDGFILRFPRRHAPDRLLPTPQSPKLLRAFQQYQNWLEYLGIESLGALNDAITAGRIHEIILVSEALHEQRIAEIARQIAERSDQVKVVLIAGPSSSGKTTFSKRLCVQLLAQGVAPYPLEMDNFFVNRDDTPKDANGQYNFEALEALDVRLLAENLRHLLNGEEVHMPKYDFRTGMRLPGDMVHLQREKLIILEGIHGLNPRLLPDFPQEETYRIYVSCLTQINLDYQNRISTTDTRLIRRIVRDAATRGYSAYQTIQRWESVRTGEKNYIFPYQENADEMFNSALLYELSALKPFAEPLLRQVHFGKPEYIEAKRLLALLEWFLPIQSGIIPDNSLLREFLGGSILAEFRLWSEQKPGG
jgi:uridine kinase